MAEFIPESTSEGLREILLGCLDHCPREYDLPEQNKNFPFPAHNLTSLWKYCSYLFCDALFGVEKRIPASILLASPWFQLHKIGDADDASSLMMTYLDGAC